MTPGEWGYGVIASPKGLRSSIAQIAENGRQQSFLFVAIGSGKK